MSRRESVLTALAIFAAALAVRAVAAAAIRYPVPEDTAYYVDAARNLLAGHGLTADALWSYQTPPLVVPRAAFEVWLPLPTFLAAIPMALLGPTFAAAQVAAVLVGALVPVLAWWLARDVAAALSVPARRTRVLAVGAGLVAALDPALVVHGALPDSTMPFAVLVLGSCMLMARLVAKPPTSARDSRLLALGAMLGIAALTRNEALWLALTWAILALVVLHAPGRRRLLAVAVPAAVAVAIYAPWAIRDWLAFGSPLPGQALSNALSVRPEDVFAWNDRPTLARYLAQGLPAMLEARVRALAFDVGDVLGISGMPAAPIGMLALVLMPRLRGCRALRPLLLASSIILAASVLLFPVSTLWGTFLHSAGAIHVLLVVAAALGLDAAIVAIGRIRGWTRPVAWLGPALVLAVAAPLCLLSVRTLASVATDRDAGYQAAARDLAAAGLVPADIPVVSDHPIWIAYSVARSGLALPDEPAADVLDLAARFGVRVVLADTDAARDLAARASSEGIARCFEPVPLPRASAFDLAAFALRCP